uniref:Putative secreted protein n=1 Tax=Rhipicephalus microplus TaxID=6941 RepID=A0A6G5A4T1_RHIMP
MHMDRAYALYYFSLLLAYAVSLDFSLHCMRSPFLKMRVLLNNATFHFPSFCYRPKTPHDSQRKPRLQFSRRFRTVVDHFDKITPTVRTVQIVLEPTPPPAITLEHSTARV